MRPADANWLPLLAALLAGVGACSERGAGDLGDGGGDTAADTDTDTDSDTGDCDCASADDNHCESECVLEQCDGCHFVGSNCCGGIPSGYCEDSIPGEVAECVWNPECGGDPCTDLGAGTHCYEDFAVIECTASQTTECEWTTSFEFCEDTSGDCPGGSGCQEVGGSAECYCWGEPGADAGMDAGFAAI